MGWDGWYRAVETSILLILPFLDLFCTLYPCLFSLEWYVPTPFLPRARYGYRFRWSGCVQYTVGVFRRGGVGCISVRGACATCHIIGLLVGK